ncbi:bifunctional folylpolyglutamate synthase/dihydrofolate synthase [Streptococcus massiliensis]|uniref:tetrahydrofolate synthase n=1 Tax=Streptococcus massiliensis TaxID=313439 RepID=A0A380KY22_9STRE|nr:folylpolyglutamate synthase/dihydrofolate synthase family protein [Streptococcus massiliensis]SUN76451.1 dihydrofolate synthase [Streptococcus massiliensis]
MQEILNWLNSRIGLNFRSGLERVRVAAWLLGNPQEAYPIIHVTGTNGKGSTIAFMRELFQAQGKKVATFTSPHMVSIHDRICINAQPISDEDFVRLAKDIQIMEKKLVKTQAPLSYFEILTLLAWLYFREQKVDLCLLEVGIGGLLDTTNIVTGEIAVITSVGLDHQETLGTTVEEIAAQKAGIFKAGKKAVVGPLPKLALQVCEECAKKLGTELLVYGKDFSMINARDFVIEDFYLPDLDLGLSGAYQAENAAVALEAFLLFIHNLGETVDNSLIRQALSATRWAGRLESFGEQIILDGAHNLPAMKGLVDFIKQEKNRSITVLFGALKRKDYSQMLDYLQRELPDVNLFVTTFSYDGSLEKADVKKLTFVENYEKFVENYLENRKKEDLLFITGSLYFIAEVRKWLLNQSF